MRSTARSVRVIEALPRARTARSAVMRLWQTLVVPDLDRLQRVYIHAGALGILGADPCRKVIARSDEEWLDAVRDCLVASGPGARRAPRVAELVDAALIGFHLSKPVTDDRNSCRRRSAISRVTSADQ